jgi:lysozyme
MSLLTAACGHRAAPVSEAAPESKAVRAAAASLAAPRFGDADPVDWPGRSPRAYPVHGVDTSRWQGQIDWPTARANGVSFAFLKATEGGDGTDPGFSANWAAAGRAGVPRGAYHFWYHCRPAAEQARWYIRHVPKAAGALPPVLDIEWTPFSPTCRLRPDAAVVRAEVATFLRIVERHYGQAAILYTTPDFYADTQLWRVAGGHEFWLRSVKDHPAAAFSGRTWTFWQYSGTGLVPGVAGRTDLNVFAGSEEGWANWLAGRAQ